MNEMLRGEKSQYLLSSTICVVMGFFFILKKESVLNLIGSAFALVLITIGAVYLCSYFLDVVGGNASVIMALIILSVGVWFLIYPKLVASLIPIIIGVVLAFDGVKGIMKANETRIQGFSSWYFGMVFSIVGIILGIICISNAYKVMKNATVFMGLILVYNGATSFWVAYSLHKTEVECCVEEERKEVIEARDEGGDGGGEAESSDGGAEGGDGGDEQAAPEATPEGSEA